MEDTENEKNKITNKAYKILYLVRSKNFDAQVKFDFDNKLVIFTGDWKRLITFEALIVHKPKYIIKHLSRWSDKLV